LKAAIKISFIFIFLFCANYLYAQDGKNMLPLSNKLLLNPSFAGWNKNTTVQAGDYFMSESKTNLNHVFYLTYDTYSEKMKGGLGYYFYQELYGNRNINETGLGFTYSKPISRGKGKQVIPSFNLNYKLATKQWFVQMMEPLNPPGTEFLRYNVILPRAGILWDSSDRQFGLSVAYSVNIQLTEEGDPPPENTPEIILLYSQSIKGKQNGLISRPYNITPEIAVLYSGEMFLTRASLQISEVEKSYGFFLQNNFGSNLHGFGGIYGWNFSRFKLNLSAGAAYNIESDDLAYFGEISLKLLIPYISFDKKNPWATPNKLF
jgi:hypothetical protein